jgi:hypothetical protein
MEHGSIQRVAPPPARQRSPLGAGVAWFLIGSSMFWPRLFIIGFWIFGSELGRAFGSWVIPALGFLVLPWTTVWYAFMWGVSSDRVSGWEWLVVAAAFVVDLVTWAGIAAVRGRPA